MNRADDAGSAAKRNDRTFAAMAAAYALGVFNDNYFKQAAMLLAIGAGLAHLQGTATTVFALPFILCSAYAGWLADRFPKKRVVVHGKLLELCAMLVGAVGIVTANWAAILAMVFLMGLQSAIFGPALNGSIPEHFPSGEVVRINGLLKMATTMAILVGIALAGICLDFSGHLVAWAVSGEMLVAVVVVMVSLGGLTASLAIEKHRAAAPDKPFPWAGPLHSLTGLWHLRRDRQLFLAVGSDAFFYFLATLVVLIVNTLGLDLLRLSRTVTSLLSVALMVGVALGAVFAARRSTAEGWQKVLLPGATGMALGLMAAARAVSLPEGIRLPLLFGALIITGFSGGFFLIPITSFIQIRPARSDKGQVMGLVGFASFCGILLAGQLYGALDGVMDPVAMLAAAGAMSLGMALFYAVRFSGKKALARAVTARMLRTVLALRYKVEVKGLEKIESGQGRGGILFLANHPALIDPVILLSILYGDFCPRPLADHDQTDRFYLRPLMKLIRAIRIPHPGVTGRTSRDAVRAGIAAVAKALRQGDNILLYPAGRLYRSCREEIGANSAVATVLSENPGQRLVLVRTTGLWGSSFSWAAGRMPSPFGGFYTYLLFFLANGFFFGPRRRVEVEFVEPAAGSFPAEKMAVNRTLTSFFNKRVRPNTHVPCLWWQGRKGRILPEPKPAKRRRDLSHLPPAVKEPVKARLAGLAGGVEIREEDRLGADLGLDSLTIMELAVWLEKEFGLPVEDPESLVTAGDVMLAACGETGGRGRARGKRIPAAWFAGSRRTALDLARADTVAGAFLAAAAREPDRPIIADRRSGVKTYRQCVMGIMLLEKVLARRKDRHLGIMLPASNGAVLSYFATLFAGKVPVMLNWTIGPEPLAHCLEIAGVHRVVTARVLIEKLVNQGIDLSSLPVEWIYLEDLVQEISPAEKLTAFARSRLSWAGLREKTIAGTAAILFTSGSEALPKAVPLSHANILANLEAFTGVLSLRGDDRLLGMLPPFHSLGLSGTVIMPLCLGLKTTYHANPTEGAGLARLIGEYRSTLVIGTPTFVNGIIRQAAPANLESLRLLFTGAEACPAHVHEEVRRRLPGAVILEGYGVTECSPVVSVNTPEDPRPGTIGRVLPGMEYRIVGGEDFAPKAPGEKGLLLVRGDNVFAGYLREDNASCFVELDGKTWYNTGDLVSVSRDGVLSFKGRRKRFIKLGGEMISLPAIEAVLREHFPPAEQGGPSLAVEATAGDYPELVLFTTFTAERQEINRTLRRAGLSALHNIRRLVRLEAIPVLGTGKTDYRRLKAVLTEN